MATIKAIFKYSDSSERVVNFPEKPTNVRFWLGCTEPYPVSPILVYFEGKLTPEQERSQTYCLEYKVWQHTCLLQVQAQRT